MIASQASPHIGSASRCRSVEKPIDARLLTPHLALLTMCSRLSVDEYLLRHHAAGTMQPCSATHTHFQNEKAD